MPNENARKVERYAKISVSTVNFQLALKELNCVNQFCHQFAPFMVKVLRNLWENRATLGMLPSYSKRVTPVRSNFCIYSRSREPFLPQSMAIWTFITLLGAGGGRCTTYQLKSSLLQIYWTLTPSCSCFVRAWPNDFTDLTLLKGWTILILTLYQPWFNPHPALVLLFTLISAIATIQQDSV